MTISGYLLRDRIVFAAVHGCADGAKFEDGMTYVPAAFAWPEAVNGAPPRWPRTHRDALLAATDYADSPGWRAGKADDVLAAIDARRKALRELPETHPDPLDIVWP